MLNQNFTGKSLLRLTSIKDIITFNLGRKRSDYLEKLDIVAKNILEGSCDFNDLISYEYRGKRIFKVISLESIYGLRRVNKILGRIYKVKQADRDTITEQVSSLISDTSHFTIIKGDIKNFYESIPRESIVEKVETNRILSYHNREIIRRIFLQVKVTGANGLPRGISLSSSLSELYIREFDQHVQSLEGVYYYARYVDDFVIFSHTKSNDIMNDIKSKLKELKLSLNYKKVKTLCSKNLHLGRDRLNFLGYEHCLTTDQLVKVRISQNRIRKIKTRIVLTFLDYAKNKDTNLLCLRLKFVTGNYLIREPSKSDEDRHGLMAGFYYNNKMLTDLEQVRELDIFLLKLIYSKRGSIYRAIGASDMLAARMASKGISFEKGFIHRKTYTIGKNEFIEIKKCWARESDYEK